MNEKRVIIESKLSNAERYPTKENLLRSFAGAQMPEGLYVDFVHPKEEAPDRGNPSTEVRITGIAYEGDSPSLITFTGFTPRREKVVGSYDLESCTGTLTIERR